MGKHLFFFRLKRNIVVFTTSIHNQHRPLRRLSPIPCPEIDNVIFSPPIDGEWKTDMTMPKNKLRNSENIFTLNL